VGQIKTPPLIAPLAASVRGPPGRAIFVHAGWRSRGTWLWDRLRAEAGVKAYYEPLHENLAVLSRAEISHFRPDSWGSGHGDSIPYFKEYSDLLGPRGRGVRLYERRFAFDDFFLAPNQPDPALEAYLRELLAAAAAEGRRPVLKFCRSLGRIGWMMERFPDALHTVLLRNPASQWRSSRRQMDEDGNRYFLLAPYLIMARNPGNALLADAMRRLDVAPPARIGRNFGLTVTATWRHVQRLDWAQRYRGFLAVWAATAVAACASGADVIDADSLGSDVAHREAVEGRFAEAGMTLDLHPSHGAEPVGAWAGTADEARDAAIAALAALDFVQAHRDMLPEGQARYLARTLAPTFLMPGGERLHLTRAALPAPQALDSPPMKLRQLDAALYVAAQRAVYPLRRAHYYLWRWLGWHAGPGVRQTKKDRPS
jgi:hypothetical protein